MSPWKNQCKRKVKCVKTYTLCSKCHVASRHCEEKETYIKNLKSVPLYMSPCRNQCERNAKYIKTLTLCRKSEVHQKSNPCLLIHGTLQESVRKKHEIHQKLKPCAVNVTLPKSARSVRSDSDTGSLGPQGLPGPLDPRDSYLHLWPGVLEASVPGVGTQGPHSLPVQ
eukprot:jgi/Botrbrau1/20594/Bobra.113_1s0020.1